MKLLAICFLLSLGVVHFCIDMHRISLVFQHVLILIRYISTWSYPFSVQFWPSNLTARLIIICTLLIVSGRLFLLFYPSPSTYSLSRVVHHVMSAINIVHVRFSSILMETLQTSGLLPPEDIYNKLVVCSCATDLEFCLIASIFSLIYNTIHLWWLFICHSSDTIKFFTTKTPKQEHSI